LLIYYNKINYAITGIDPIGQTIKEWKQPKNSPQPTNVTTDKVTTDNSDVVCLSLKEAAGFIPPMFDGAYARLKDYVNQKLKQ